MTLDRLEQALDSLGSAKSALQLAAVRLRNGETISAKTYADIAADCCFNVLETLNPNQDQFSNQTRKVKTCPR
jgi:hypothetical protein